MKSFKDIAYRVLYPTCAIYTVMTLLFTAIFFSSSNEYGSPGITPTGIGTILLFSFLASLANLLFGVKRFHPLLRTLLHMIALTADFALCFLVLGGYFRSAGTLAFMVLLIFAVLYLLIAIPSYVVFAVSGRKKNEAEKYDSILSKRS